MNGLTVEKGPEVNLNSSSSKTLDDSDIVKIIQWIETWTEPACKLYDFYLDTYKTVVSHQG